MNKNTKVTFLLIAVSVGWVVAAFVGMSLYRSYSVIKVDDVLTVRIKGRGQDRAEIGVRVVAVKPNGELLVACNKRIRNANELWTVSLSGYLRTCDVQPKGYVDSEVIKDFVYQKSVSYAVEDTD